MRSIISQIVSELEETGSPLSRKLSRQACDKFLPALHGRALYHLEPIEIWVTVKIVDAQYDEEIAIGVDVHSIPYDMTWTSTDEEVLTIDAGDDRSKLISDIENSVNFLLDSEATNFDSKMPDKPWPIGIDLPTAAWLKENCDTAEIRKILQNASPGSATIRHHRGNNHTKSQGRKITGGANITLDGMLITSSIDLGESVTYECGIITVPGIIATIMRDGLLGKEATAIIDHPLLKDAGYIREITDNREHEDDPTKIETAFLLDREIIEFDEYMKQIGGYQTGAGTTGPDFQD